MIRFARATFEDGVTVAGNLREFERRTVDKLGVDVRALLAKALDGEEAWTAFVDDEPATIFGIAGQTMLGEARLWMLTTPLIEKHKISLLRASRAFVQWASAAHGPVVGMVDAEFQKSLDWMHWIGFKDQGNVGGYVVMRFSNGN
jgi:hypothetical protein